MIRIGIIGTGDRVCSHGEVTFSTAADRCTVAALCDVAPDRLQDANGIYQEAFGPSIALFEDYKEMLATAELDAVYVAGPNHLHRDMTVAALEAGCHVLCEKPMETTLAKVDEMIAAANRTGKILALGMQMHYWEHYHRIKEMLDAGVIGDIVQIWCTEYRGPYKERKDWVWEQAQSGGAIVEKNCHHYDIMDLWVGSLPTTVYATGGIAKHHTPYGYRSEIVDNAWILNEYENGVHGMLGICFTGPDKGHKREFGIHGTKGRMFMSLTDKEDLHIIHADGREETLPNPLTRLRGGLWDDFVDCARTGSTPLVTPERGRRSLLVPLAAEKSIAESRVVHVNELT
jgi:predicted dehydrogenase